MIKVKYKLVQQSLKSGTPNFDELTLTKISPKPIVSPAHKGTEGRALVWGFEFTTKVASKERFIRIFFWLNAKFCDLTAW